MTDIQQIAEAYIAEGWSVVPIVAGEKRANTRWQSKTYTPSDFKPGDGIAGKCGEPSGWRVDYDLDHPLAVKIAPMLLPTTGLVHGRAGKPRSHAWYVTEGVKTRQFTDVNDSNGKKQMLCEIRSTGAYTLLPPSQHPTGDLYAWDSELTPLTLDADALNRVGAYVPLATLAAIHYPGHGARHAMVGHLAGFLCRAGVDPRFVKRIIEAAATHAGDHDLRDRMTFVDDTIAKWQANKDANLTGGPKLAEALGPDVVSKMRSWLGVADLDAYDDMNRKHFLVRVGHDELIGLEPEDDRPIQFQHAKALSLRYANQKIKVGEKVDKNKNVTDELKPLFWAWLEWPGRRSYEDLVFCPPPRKARECDYNMWRGFNIEPQVGDCSLFLDHLRDVICSGDAAHYEYLMDLLALTVQEPGTPSEVAVVLRGAPGAGKGTFVRVLETIFGRHFIQLDSVKHLVGGFNAAISSKIIVFADEAFWAGYKSSVGALKRLITEPTLTIERKGIDAVSEPNYIHLFMATNEDWSIPAQLQERRFFALHVSDTRRGDLAYFQRVNDLMTNGGTAAFLDLLLKRPNVTREKIRNVPKTKELRTQQELSLPPLLAWWQDCLFDGCVPSTYGTTWPGNEWIPVAGLYENYAEWASQRKHSVLNKIAFAKQLGEYAFHGAIAVKRVKNIATVVRAGKLKTLAEARKYFDVKMATDTEWPEDPATQLGLP